MTREDNETWLIDVGDKVIMQRTENPSARESPIERLIYCLWVADYGMRNAGDLTTASDLYANFLLDGRRISAELGLTATADLFLLDTTEFEQTYFDIFDAVCTELRNAHLR
ncbi:MAG: hypothetical protein AAF802_32010 [Planctomycetota bacterium]